MSTIEAMISNALVRKAIMIGYSISVYDGEAFALRECADQPAIIKAMGSTDSDVLHFHKVGGQSIGCVVLIWGNGRDLISDYSDNEAINALVNSVNGT